MNRWERKKTQKKRWKAAAYMRHSAQGRQENSIDIQRETIYARAERNDAEIVAEFKDAGLTGVCWRLGRVNKIAVIVAAIYSNQWNALWKIPTKV